VYVPAGAVKDIAGNPFANDFSFGFTTEAVPNPEAPTVTASPAGGLYNEPQNVSLTASEPADIYYTTDGTDPTTNSSLYTGLVYIAADTTLKFMAIDTDGNQSVIYTEIYTIAPNSSLLSGLAISNGALDPVFSNQNFYYNTSVGYDTDRITVTPTAEDSNATIEVNGTIIPSGYASQEIILNVGINTITVRVTSAAGSDESTYTINATRASSPYLSGLILKSGKATVTINPVFNPTTFAYNATVQNAITAVVVRPTALDSSAVITVNGQTVISGQMSQVIYLDVGQNIISVEVLSAVGVDQKTYTITVTRTD
jgi:sulfur carrier protein ThiS